MPLRDRNQMPPGGFPFKEPSLKWPSKKWNPFRDFWTIVGEIQMVRVQNPASGLDPSRRTVAQALDDYTCGRLQNSPRWCKGTKEQEAQEQAARNSTKRKSCSTCGKKKG